jgi:fatty acid desaturase
MLGAMDGPPTKLPLDEDGREVVQRFARWLRIAGGAQLGLASILLALLAMFFACGMMAGGMAAGGIVMIASLIPLVIVGVFVLQALRTQAAGDQFGEVANEGDVDSLEFGFARLRTVFIIDVIIGVLLLLNTLLGGMG